MGEDHLIFRRTKGRSVVTENPKEKIWKDSKGGPLKFAWKWRHGVGGGSRKSSNVIRGDHFSEVTFTGGMG